MERNRAKRRKCSYHIETSQPVVSAWWEHCSFMGKDTNMMSASLASSWCIHGNCEQVSSVIFFFNSVIVYLLGFSFYEKWFLLAFVVATKTNLVLSKMVVCRPIGFLKEFSVIVDMTSISLNPLRANPTKWSNTLKQFVRDLPKNCLSVFDHFVGLAHIELKIL